MSYIPNNEFLVELRLSQKEPTETLCNYFLLIIRSEIYHYRPNFINKEDLEMDLLLWVLGMYRKYDLNNPAPFNYFTICIHRKLISMTVRQMKKEIDEKMFRYSMGMIDGDWMDEEQKIYYEEVFIKRKERINKKGKRNPMYGKKQSEESKKKIADSVKKYYENKKKVQEENN